MSDIPPDVAELLGVTGDPQPGATMRLPVRRSDSYTYGVATQVTVNSVVPESIDFVAVANLQRASHQNVVMSAKDQNGMAFSSSGLQLVPEVVELMSFRTTSATALEMAVLILRTLAQEMPRTDILDRLAAEGWQ